MTQHILFDSDSQEEPPDWVQIQSHKARLTLHDTVDSLQQAQKSTLTSFYTYIFVLLSVLIGWSTTLAWRSTDSLFMTKLGSEALTDAYCIASCFMIVIGTVIIRLINSITAAQLLKAILSVGIALFTGFASFIAFYEGFDTPTFWFVAKIANQLFSILACSGFWLFYDQYFIKRYSSKHYALLCCASFVGYGFAGLVLHFNQGSALSSFSWQLVLITLSLGCVYLIAKIQPQTYHNTKNVVHFNDQSSLRDYLVSLLKSPIACVLAFLTMLLFVLSTTAEYTYLYMFEDYYQSTSTAWVESQVQSDMAKTLGTCCALVGIGNLVTGIFLYCRCYLPLRILAWLAPVFAGSAFLFWHKDPQLVYPAIAVLIVDGLYPLIEDNNVNGLVGAVPSKLKQKIRLLIETFSEPVGMLFSSILIAYSSMSPAHLIGIVASFVAAVCLSLLVERYRRSHAEKPLAVNTNPVTQYDVLKAS